MPSGVVVAEAVRIGIRVLRETMQWTERVRGRPKSEASDKVRPSPHSPLHGPTARFGSGPAPARSPANEASDVG
ncbi:hypothetical protein L1887_53580 [Cichorium endivia]|nr:hypothetical protein L1887_53580 [Cichorium endivia]